MLILAINNTIKYYQDLFTKERKSVKENNTAEIMGTNKSELTNLYKLYNTLILIAVYLYLFSSISGVLNHAATTNEECTIAIRAIIGFLQAGNTLKYLVYLIKLYILRRYLKFSHPKACLPFLAIFTICCGIFMIILTIFVIDERVQMFNDNGCYTFRNREVMHFDQNSAKIKI